MTEKKDRGCVRRVRLTLTEEALGSQPGSKSEFDGFFHDRAVRTIVDEAVRVDPETGEQLRYSEDEANVLVGQERGAISADDVLDRGKTVFPRDEQGRPCMYGYQLKGAFKEACGFLRRVKRSKSAKITAYRKVIDGLIFVDERMSPFIFDSGEIGDCTRPLRANTPQGERVSIARSETVPAGATITFTIVSLEESFWPAIEEWLDYFNRHGLCQWRNSGKGTCTWEYVD